MRTIVKHAAVAVLLVLVAVYAGDWLVYRYRRASGTVLDSVQVNQFMSVSLKGQKEEFDYLGQERVECVRTLLPWTGLYPCWWVRRHAENWTKA